MIALVSAATSAAELKYLNRAQLLRAKSDRQPLALATAAW